MARRSQQSNEHTNGVQANRVSACFPTSRYWRTTKESSCSEIFRKWRL
jgi:hypothetical protein